MVSIKLVEANGAEHVIEAEPGLSVMRAAVESGIEGISGICGGNCACATCHCYVDVAWLGKLSERGELEEEMLDETNSERRPESRLSCQIVLSDDLDGLTVHLPAVQ